MGDARRMRQVFSRNCMSDLRLNNIDPGVFEYNKAVDVREQGNVVRIVKYEVFWSETVPAIYILSVGISLECGFGFKFGPQSATNMNDTC